MTFEQRMAELDVDLSDLPNNKHTGMPYPVSRYESLLKQAADFTGFDAPAGFEVFNVLQYALHLVDIIDRMETRLVNVTGERDYLLTQIKEDCPICANANPDNRLTCAKYIDVDIPDDCYEFGGVPEDWSADD